MNSPRATGDIMREENRHEEYAVWDVADYVQFLDEPETLAHAMQMAMHDMNDAYRNGSVDEGAAMLLAARGMEFLGTMIVEGTV